MNPIEVIEDFEKTVDRIYGVYLDSTSGFSELVKRLENQQKASFQQLQKADAQLTTIEDLDQRAYIYGKGNPNDPEAIELHRCTQLEYKKRNGKGGLNFLFIGNMTLVSVYQYWEDYYRGEIAKMLGVSKNDLKEPIMGDLRLIRHSIVHHSGIALPDIKSCEVLNWLDEGDTIFLDKKQFEKVIFEIKKMILRLKERAKNL